MKLNLEQGQTWKQGERYFRIVDWERLAIEYKELTGPASSEGTTLRVTNC